MRRVASAADRLLLETDLRSVHARAGDLVQLHGIAEARRNEQPACRRVPPCTRALRDSR